MSKMNIVDLSEDIINMIKNDVMYHNVIKALIYEYSKECVMRERDTENLDKFLEKYLIIYATYSEEKKEDLKEEFEFTDYGLKILKDNNNYNKTGINEMIYDRLYKSGVDGIDIRYYRYTRNL